MRASEFLLGISIAISTNPLMNAADWLQFRGAQANGITTEEGFPNQWDEQSNIKWQASVPGEGWSAPIIVNGKVIVTTAVSQGQKNRDSKHEWQIICFDETSGKKLWSKTATTGNPRLGTHRDNTYASETPVSDGTHVVVYFGMTGLYCYDLDGNELWKKDLGSFPMQNDWGTSSSPTLQDGLVFLQVDNEERSFLTALDIKTGNEKWRKDRDERSNWGSPILWKNSKRTELVTSGRIVRSYNPADGQLLWQLTLEAGGVSSTPAAEGDLLVVGSQGRGGSGMFAVNAGASGDVSLKAGELSNASVAWGTRELGPQRSSPLIYQGYLYLLGNRGGQITCLDAKTGKKIFQERLPDSGPFWASPWVCNGLIYCPDELGNTFVIKPGPKLDIVSINKLPSNNEARYWATSGMANGVLYIRSSNAIYAVGKN